MSSCVIEEESMSWATLEAEPSTRSLPIRIAESSSRGQPIRIAVPETLWRWKRLDNGAWWSLHGEPAANFRDKRNENWEGLQFKLTDRKQNEFQCNYPPAGRSAFDYNDISESLLDILDDIAAFRVVSDIRRIDFLLPNVLKMAKSSAPILDHLEVTGKGVVTDLISGGKFDFSILLDAAKSGKLMGLKSLVWTADITTTGDTELQSLAAVIGTGGCGSLSVLAIRSKHVGGDGVIALATSLAVGGLTQLSKLDLSFEFFTDKAMQSIAHAVQSGDLISLRVLNLYQKRAFKSEDPARTLVSSLLNSKSPKVTEVNMDSHQFPCLHRELLQLLQRNRKQLQIMAEIGVGLVPANLGKVYLCGDPMVGKTTLRKSLERSSVKSFVPRETTLISVERTRSIDVSLLRTERRQEKDSVTLLLLDMAGHPDYHNVHNAFFPDISPNKGNAKIFLVMCRSDDIMKGEQEIGYWLKFISSGLDTGTQGPREVCVVVNLIDGDSDILEKRTRWTDMVVRVGKRFEGVLNMSPCPFFADVRKRNAVRVIKQHLIQRSRSMLESKMIPGICHFFQKNLSVWSKERKHIPVLPWNWFLILVGRTGAQWPEKTVKAAVQYLDESGILIYIDKEFPAEWGVPDRPLVILDPNWFCRDIAGYMFLPKEMAQIGDHPFREKADPRTGSIPITLFNECLRDLVGGWDRSVFEDLTIILLCLGLCYKGRDENLLIPSLASADTAHVHSLFQNDFHQDVDGKCQWVIAYSVEHVKTELGLAPIALWHRFQVELGQTTKFNSLVGDNDFLAGKYFVSFKVDHLAVLIKVHVDREQPTFEHIDLFVRPLLEKDRHVNDLETTHQSLIRLASDLLETLMTLWGHVCPGIDCVEHIAWRYPLDGKNLSRIHLSGDQKGCMDECES